MDLFPLIMTLTINVPVHSPKIPIHLYSVYCAEYNELIPITWGHLYCWMEGSEQCLQLWCNMAHTVASTSYVQVEVSYDVEWRSLNYVFSYDIILAHSDVNLIPTPEVTYNVEWRSLNYAFIYDVILAHSEINRIPTTLGQL